MYVNSFGQLVSDDYLAHFGIPGMHWGIRRFQPYPKGYTGDGKFKGKRSESKARKYGRTRIGVTKQRVIDALKIVGAVACVAAIWYSPEIVAAVAGALKKIGSSSVTKAAVSAASAASAASSYSNPWAKAYAENFLFGKSR